MTPDEIQRRMELEIDRLKEEVRTMKAKRDLAAKQLAKLRKAAKAVDATWNADEPYPLYMDAIDTDRLLALRKALKVIK